MIEFRESLSHNEAFFHAPSRGDLVKALRLERILKFLRNKGYATVKELAGDLGVSEVTVRRDLEELKKQGLVYRKRGGVFLRSLHYELSFFSRLERQREEKIKIAEKAVKLIQNGWTIFTMGGTTIYYLIQALDDSHIQSLTVITNSITTAWAVINLKKEFNLIHTGGAVRRGSFECVGEQVADAIDHIKFDLAIVGTDGIDPKEGITVSNYSESLLARRIKRRAKTMMVVSDSSKFGVIKPYKALDISELDLLITDPGIPESFARSLSNSGVELHIAL